MVGIKNNRYETDNIVSTLGTVEAKKLSPVEIHSTTKPIASGNPLALFLCKKLLKKRRN